MGYERDFLMYLESITAELDRKIRRHQQRLDLTGGDPNPREVPTPDPLRIEALESKINQLVTAIEERGAEGKVEEAQAMMSSMQALERERDSLLGPSVRTGP